MERLPLELTVNGRTHTVGASPETTLLQVLREELQLKGAKDACGLEQCGACRVIIDGEALPSCRMSAREAVGKNSGYGRGSGYPRGAQPHCRKPS